MALAQKGNSQQRRHTLRSHPTGLTGVISTTSSKSLAHFAARLTTEPTFGWAWDRYLALRDSGTAKAREVVCIKASIRPN